MVSPIGVQFLTEEGTVSGFLNLRNDPKVSERDDLLGCRRARVD